MDRNELDRLATEITKAIGEFIDCVIKEHELRMEDPDNDQLPFVSQTADRAHSRAKLLISRQDEIRKAIYAIPDSDTDGDAPGGEDS